MNKESTLRLDKTLGVIEKIVPEPTYIEKITGDVRDGCSISSNITSEDVDKDYKYQRENLYNLIEKFHLRLNSNRLISLHVDFQQILLRNKIQLVL